ncbi:superoxide dismutase, Ni [Anaerohalosphaera lusitana]|uniref:Superoxide dismutase, Ni n=1 Tax=Anaerohalosphaera lusitana TaxID=1936003 RepID=A0A1U9NP31_9BACT|nr:superoxide dismutase [Ni] [Anaerohalosphaera lusitana]AQT69478.1 superoxide dismutase, Ni [Anaerohalosphaera lusitana]
MKTKAITVIGLLMAAAAPIVYSHCQIPCGIYDDQARIGSMAEDIRTIEKSMKQIEELSIDPGKNANQLVRWVTNKEEHAQKFSEDVTYYFMAQRLAPPEEGASVETQKEYNKQLTLLHKLLYNAMKAKQTTDLEYVAELRALLGDFEKAYFDEDSQAAMSDHGHEHGQAGHVHQH